MLELIGRFDWWVRNGNNAPSVVQAYAAIAAVFLTCVIGAMTWWNTLLTRRLLAAQRPWVLVDGLVLSTSPDLSAGIAFEGHIKNFGNAPALAMRTKSNLALYNAPLPKKLLLSTPQDINSNVLGPDKVALPRHRIALTEEHISGIKDGSVLVVWHGITEYKDPLGKKHSTEWCWIYNWSRQTFTSSEREDRVV